MTQKKKKKQTQNLLNDKSPSFLVIDEWLFHCLDGSNGSEKQYIAGLFILGLLNKYEGKVLVLAESPFQKKLNKLRLITDPRIRGLSQLLHTSIINNSEKTIFIQKDQISDLPARLTKIPLDDQYLFQLFLKKRNSCIVTCDNRLISILRANNIRDITIMTIENFITVFFS